MHEFTVPRLVEPLRSGGLADSVFTTAERDPRHLQFSRPSDNGRVGGARRDISWVPVTAAAFRDDVLAAARGFLANGIRLGDRVALMSRTRYEWTLLAYALWTVGAEVVPVYPTSSVEQVRWILQDTGATGIVVENENHAMTVAAAYGSQTALTRIWQLDSGCVAALEDDGTGVSDEDVHRQRAAVAPGNPAAICYTSGTTGRPKGCVITHANLASECDNLLAGWSSLLEAPGEPPSLLAFLPLSHCYGLMVVVGSVRGGVHVAHQPDLSPESLLPALASFRPTFLFGVPYIFETVLARSRAAAQEAGHGTLFRRAAQVAVRYAEAAQRQSLGRGQGPGPRLRLRHAVYERLVYAKLRAVLGGRVRHAVSGGSPLSRETGLFFAGAGITVYDGYGLTETTAAVTAQPVGAVRFGTVGRPLPGCSVHIARDGEIWVRGDVVFSGYLNNPQATGTALRGDWFATGDLGHLDDGYLVITGRKKDVIITSGGKSMSPLVLEEELRGHPLISQCVVVGDNRPYVAALITLDPQALHHWQRLKGRPPAEPGTLTDDEELRAQIQRAVSRANTRVSRAESIREFRILPGEFTPDTGLLTPSLKLRRSAILAAYAQDVERLYTPRAAASFAREPFGRR
ncbi:MULTISPECIES: AMP-dependent synthetase/ligase [unclassified Streptomyces]|uniref:AMP-dependent synthetase/ligase n=1 Tax=unclassified Streptomyces TaxID=2593676 RepID=UPI00362CF3AB